MKRLVAKWIQKHRKNALSACGAYTYIAKECQLHGNIYVGEHVVVGRGAYFVSTRANIHVHDHVIFGPNVTIYTGDHPINIIGKHISELTDADKADPKLDQDVVIESGCWIGTGAIILKGVTIGRGSVIGAGAVVTKDVPPYSVYVGVPSARTFARFDSAQIEAHEKLLRERGIAPDSMQVKCAGSKIL